MHSGVEIEAMEHTRMMIQLEVNGREVLGEIAPFMTLAEFLRRDLGLTGAKLSCEVGECGSCTVLLDDRPVTSCLVPAAQAAGRRVRTIEGLTPGGSSHPVQQAFVSHNAVQCGFCIPGMIMAASALLERDPDPEPETIRVWLSGNLCRCTGYQKIVDAVLSAARQLRRES